MTSVSSPDTVPTLAVINNDLDTLRRAYPSPITLSPAQSHMAIDRAARQDNLEAVFNIICPSANPDLSKLLDWARTSLEHDCEKNLRYLERKFPRGEAFAALAVHERRTISNIRSYLAAADGNVPALQASMALLNVDWSQMERRVRKAIQKGHLNVVAYLLSDADGLSSSWNNIWPTYIAEAAECNNPHILKHFLVHPETLENAEPAHIGDAMLVAAQNNATETLPMLISFFEGYKEFPAYARQAFKVAAYHGSRDALSILSRYVPASMDYKALQYAARGGQVDLTRALLRSVAKPGVDLSRAAFAAAAHAGQWEVAKDLLLGAHGHFLTGYLEDKAHAAQEERHRITANQLWLHGF